MQLFRREALRAQDRLHGELSLAPPVSWQLIGVFLASSLAVAAVFLARGGYAKATLVTGTLASDKGVVRVAPPRAGVIERLLVGEGQRVRRGDMLAVLSTDTAQANGTLQYDRLRAIELEGAAVAARAPALAAALAARLDGLRAELAAADAAGASAGGQRGEQAGLVAAAEYDLAQARLVAERGFVSARDVRARETELALRRQALMRLDEAAGAARSRVVVARAAMIEARGQLAVQMTAVAQERAALRRSLADDGNARSVVVRAAADGVVAGLAAHQGDAVSPDTSMMQIVPDGARLHAVLRVPPATVGLIRPGEAVRVSVDAYPYQVYGTVPARLAQLSPAAVSISRADGTRDEVFLARAELARVTLDAYDRPEPLRAGMTVSARVLTRPRSFAQWLFDPLLAVGRR